MSRRYAFLWFRHLLADWRLIRRPDLKDVPFVFAVPDHGRMLITAVSTLAEMQGLSRGMRVADAKAICLGLVVLDDKPERVNKLLKGLGEWCIRYTPIVAVETFSADGLILDISGCTHLWGGEKQYLREVVSRFKSKGYTVRMAIADTPGAAWAIAHYGSVTPIIPSGGNAEPILNLPPDALRLDEGSLAKLQKLGFYRIKSFIDMPRSVLRRRFGNLLLTRLAQALGIESETVQPLNPPEPFQARLPCLEPIRTRSAIEIAIQKLLEDLCKQLADEGKGLRTGILTCYRIDGKMMQIEIGTNSPTHQINHLFKLLALKIDQIRPGLGIELFSLDAPKVEPVVVAQEVLWQGKPGLKDHSVSLLLDRVAGKVGAQVIRRYLPDTHYWPERAVKQSSSLSETPQDNWRTDNPRPMELLRQPESIEVMALIPDHPPRLFIYKNTRHNIVRAEGPERIEREWWLDVGEHRDYYQVEDDQGRRYWLFRSGHYSGDNYQWFIHGFFA